MKLDEVWDWLESFTNLEKTPGLTKREWRLERMQALLEARGNPEKAPFTLHVAGSKGKGSTCAFLASILTEAGWNTGLYSSPHIADWRERITQNGVFFPDSLYTETFEALKEFWTASSSWDDLGGPPSTFEWLTLAAFEIFRNADLDAQVMETGLGGRLDATNVVRPQASVLTLIELEHTEILGHTLEAIAGEKAGIIKPGIPAFSASQSLEALGVFRSRAARSGSEFFAFDEEVDDLDIRLSQEGTDLKVVFRDGAEVAARLPFLGYAQAQNAAFSALVIRKLVQKKILRLKTKKSLEEVLIQGLEKTVLPGRMEKLRADPVLVVDGAHTEKSVRLLSQSWTELFGTEGVLIFGAFEGKDLSGMARELCPIFSTILLTPPGFYRKSDPEAMRAAFTEAALTQGAFPEIETLETPDQALSMALQVAGNRPILVCGSFYLVGEIKRALKDLSPST